MGSKHPYRGAGTHAKLKLGQCWRSTWERDALHVLDGRGKWDRRIRETRCIGCANLAGRFTQLCLREPFADLAFMLRRQPPRRPVVSR